LPFLLLLYALPASGDYQRNVTLMQNKPANVAHQMKTGVLRHGVPGKF